MCFTWMTANFMEHGWMWNHEQSWSVLLTHSIDIKCHRAVALATCVKNKTFNIVKSKMVFWFHFGDMYNYVQFIVHSIVQAKVKMYNVKMLWLLHATTASEVKKVKMVWNYTLSRLSLDVRCSEYTYQHHLIKKRRLISLRNIPEDITRVHLC